MIPAVGDEISELERTWEIVVKKQVLRLSDLFKVSQPTLEFGFSFPVEKCILCPTLLSQNACFDFWRREMEGRVKFFSFSTWWYDFRNSFVAVSVANNSSDIVEM